MATDFHGLLTAEEAAKRAGVSRSRLYADVRAGRLAKIKLGSSTRFHPDAVDAYVAWLTANYSEGGDQ